jgi:hypothetical protein
MFLRTTCVSALATLVLILGNASRVQADEPSLKPATIALAAAATADWATTYHALTHYRLRENNPLIRPFDDTPGRMVSIGGAIDVAAVAVWNTSVGRSHPRAAVAGLWTMAAFRAFLAIHNIRNERVAARR